MQFGLLAFRGAGVRAPELGTGTLGRDSARGRRVTEAGVST